MSKTIAGTIIQSRVLLLAISCWYIWKKDVTSISNCHERCCFGKKIPSFLKAVFVSLCIYVMSLNADNFCYILIIFCDIYTGMEIMNLALRFLLWKDCCGTEWGFVFHLLMALLRHPNCSTTDDLQYIRRFHIVFQTIFSPFFCLFFYILFTLLSALFVFTATLICTS